MKAVQTYKLLLFLLTMAITSSCAAKDITDIKLIVRPWYKFRADGQPGREISLVPVGGNFILPATVLVDCEGSKETVQVTTLSDTISLLLPVNVSVSKECQLRVTLQSGNQQLFRNIIVPAKRQWTVYIYPHAHVDIGYTALQETVEKLQVRNIDVGIDLARKTQHYPEGARFVWNPEATWVVSSYLRTATPEKKKAFIEAVQKGWLQVDAGHSNINTSICSDEEQMRLFRNIHNIQSVTGVPVTTMVQMDLPGAGWGMVQAAVQNGVHGFISFPNYYDVRKTWEHKPFYWIGPDGKSRLLFLQAFPYGIGYTIKGSKYGLKKIQTLTGEYDRLQSEAPLKNFIDPFIFEETARLERADSPYDIFAMTWSMADNCLIDADLPEAVRSWNATYAFPKLKIAGSREIIEAYETKYASIIPTYKGDFTEYWTDGLGSDARRVALSRRGKEDLVQAETLWQMLNKGSSPAFNEAWENLLLAAEHTWGFQVTGTPMARQVEDNKAAYFENAAAISKRLLAPVQKNTDTIAVINTLSWSRNGLVILSAAQSNTGDRVLDEKGREVLSQRLTTGELVFMAGNIPALGAACYRIVPGKCSLASTMTTSPLGNEFVSLTIDKETGAIISLIDRKTNRELVNTSLNSYHYQTGVYNGTNQAINTTAANKTVVHVKENGPLIVSLSITSNAPGCNALTREVRLVHGERMVQFINTMNKIATREKEAIHFGFSFNIPAGTIRMDIPWGVMIPDQDQLPGANKNWLAFQRWIDISNQNYGVTFTALESPIVELGDITGTILDGARQAERWIKTLPATQTIYSWPVNNHWDTNFPPQQEGMITTTYCLQLHEQYDVVAANRFGVEQHRPLIAVQTAVNPVAKPLLALDNLKLMIAALKASEDNKAMIVRLRSFSGKPEKLNITYPAGAPQSVYLCMAGEKPLQKINGSITVPPYGTVSLRMVIKRTN